MLKNDVDDERYLQELSAEQNKVLDELIDLDSKGLLSYSSWEEVKKRYTFLVNKTIWSIKLSCRSGHQKI